VDFSIAREKSYGMSGAVKWQSVSEQEWDSIPVAPKKSKESPWDDLLQAVIDGEIVSLPIDNEKDLRGIRIALARRGNSGFGVKLAFRYDEGRKMLAVRLGSEKQEKPAATSGEKRGPGRPKKA
jgi:hypothetical protein